MRGRTPLEFCFSSERNLSRFAIKKQHDVDLHPRGHFLKKSVLMRGSVLEMLFCDKKLVNIVSHKLLVVLKKR